MKNIIFRGKRSYDKKWVYGSLLIITKEKYPQLISDMYCIIPKDEYVYYDANFMLSEMNEYNVIPETVGQLSGLTDKNGKEIYEGDIVNYDFFKMDSGHHQAKILFQTCYSTKHISNTYTRNLDYIDYSFEWLSRTNSNITIIGNIHDNPELLTEK